MLPSSDDPVLGAITFEALAENYYAQAKALVEGGVDVLLVETAQDILEVKAAIAGFERLFAEIGYRGPDAGSGHARHERSHAARHRCGERAHHARRTPRRRRRPQLLDGARAHAGTRPLPHRARDSAHLRDPECRDCRSTPAPATPSIRWSRRRWRARSSEFVRDFGVRIVGGCCGTTPEHLRAVVEAVRAARGRRTGAWGANGRRPAPVARVSSAMRAITICTRTRRRCSWASA